MARLVHHSGNGSLTDMVAHCARVSNNNPTTATASNEKLIKYLIGHQHWSPFEMVSICLEIETTRDISRQILRHRSFSFQEFSQRYAAVEGTMKIREARMQDPKNRQNSVETDDVDLQVEWAEKQRWVQTVAEDVYSWALQQGIAKEQARVVLPEGNCPTRMYMHGTLRSWIHYIALRTEEGTQKEHRQIAKACAEAIEPLFPMIRDFVH